jgi:hypothetical protein
VTTRPKWDEHILVVFSVLAGLSFAEAFNVLASSNFGTAEVILSVAVFYIVLDNWYFLHRDLAVIDLEYPTEVILYLLSLLTYACLPYLYGNKSKSATILSPPEWLLMNLALICLLDAVRKTVTVYRIHKMRQRGLSEAEKRLAGAYIFYFLTGYFYSVLLFLSISFSLSSTRSLTLKSLLVVVAWAIIRGVDRLVIPRISDLVARIFLESQPQLNGEPLNESINK